MSLKVLSRIAVAALAVGCGGLTSGRGTPGTVSIELDAIPNEVRCVQISADGQRDVIKRRDVSPGKNEGFTLTGLPLGRVVFEGLAFEAKCRDLGDSPVAEWIADPVIAEVSLQARTPVHLTFVRNGRALVTTDFVDDVSAPGEWGQSTWGQALWQ